DASEANTTQARHGHRLALLRCHTYRQCGEHESEWQENLARNLRRNSPCQRDQSSSLVTQLDAQPPICSIEQSCVRHAFTMHWDDSLWRYVMSNPSLRQ